MVYYKPKDIYGTSYEFAFAMPFMNGTSGVQFVPFNTFQPSLDPADKDNLVANWIQLTNLSNSKQRGTLIFRGQDGHPLGSQPVILPAGARRDFPGHKFGNNLVGTVRWKPDSTTAKFQLRNVRYFYDNSLGRDSFTTAFQLEGLVGSGELLTVPLDTNQSSAVIEIANATAAVQNVGVNIYQSDGALLKHLSAHLAPYGSVHIITDSFLNGKQCLATIKGSRSEGVVAVVMQYGRTPSLGINYIYGIPARQPVGSVLRSSYNTFLQQGCILLLGNPTNSKTAVSMSMTRYADYQALTGESVTVPAHGLVDYNLCANEMPNTYGVATIQPTRPNSLVSSVVRIGHNDNYRFPTPVRQ